MVYVQARILDTARIDMAFSSRLAIITGGIGESKSVPSLPINSSVSQVAWDL